MSNRKGIKDKFLETLKDWCNEKDYTLEVEDGKYEDIIKIEKDSETLLELEKHPTSWSIETKNETTFLRPPVFYKIENSTLMFKGKKPKNTTMWRKLTITEDFNIKTEHNKTKDPRKWS